MTPIEKQAYLKKIYGLAIAAGRIRKVSDFADALEVERSGLSSAMNGREKNLTDRLIRKVQKWAKANGLETEEGEEVKPMPVPEVIPPADWKERLIESQQRTIESQQRTIEALTQMQAGVSPYMAGVYAPKNLRTEK